MFSYLSIKFNYLHRGGPLFHSRQPYKLGLGHSEKHTHSTTRTLKMSHSTPKNSSLIEVDTPIMFTPPSTCDNFELTIASVKRRLTL